MRPTIKDIAAKTGLSITTVSFVLNNKPSRISEKSRKLVLDAARELDYRPNELAVGLIKKRTKTLGLILSDICNPFFSNLAKGVEYKCLKRGWTVILCDTEDQSSQEISYIDMLSSKSVDGIIYCCSQDSTAQKFRVSWQMMQHCNLPCIVADRTYDLPGALSVRTDHVLGGWLATNHLLQLGHRRIACVTGPAQLSVCRSRLEGYKRALNEYGIAFDSALVAEGQFDMESGRRALDALDGQEFTSLFAFNDIMAFGVYQGLKARGLSVPSDVSVVGYDDSFPSEILDVPLTTVHQPVREIGARAADELISILEGGSVPTADTVFEPRLVVRSSTRRLKQEEQKD